jgi:hypothetical protein
VVGCSGGQRGGLCLPNAKQPLVALAEGFGLEPAAQLSGPWPRWSRRWLGAQTLPDGPTEIKLIPNLARGGARRV